MTGAELTTALEYANAEDLIWSVFAEHQDGAVELHSLGPDEAFASTIVADFPRALAEMDDVSHVLTGPQPVSCAAAAAAGIAMLGDCGRCDQL